MTRRALARLHEAAWLLVAGACMLGLMVAGAWATLMGQDNWPDNRGR